MQGPVSETKAWTYALLNVAATPGLGSLLARRWLSGSVQLMCSVAGFCLLMGWMIQKFRLFYGQMMGTTLPLDSGDRMGTWGLIIFVVAWCWALITSIQIVRSAARSPSPLEQPPVIQSVYGENR